MINGVSRFERFVAKITTILSGWGQRAKKAIAWAEERKIVGPALHCGKTEER